MAGRTVRRTRVSADWFQKDQAGRSHLGAVRHCLYRVEMRTVAGPSSVEQWVLSGGPYTV